MPLAAALVPAQGRTDRQHQEDRVQGVHALHVGLAPEARADGEQERAGGGGGEAQPQAAAEVMEEPARPRLPRPR